MKNSILRADNITGNARQNFLTSHNGKEVKGKELLTSLRAVNLIDGQPKLKMKVYAWLTKQINVKGKVPSTGKISYEGITKDPSRKKANLSLGLSKAQIEELKDVSTSTING